jgi:hypothetical protein
VQDGALDCSKIKPKHAIVLAGAIDVARSCGDGYTVQHGDVDQPYRASGGHVDLAERQPEAEALDLLPRGRVLDGDALSSTSSRLGVAARLTWPSAL